MHAGFTGLALPERIQSHAVHHREVLGGVTGVLLPWILRPGVALSNRELLQCRRFFAASSAS